MVSWKSIKLLTWDGILCLGDAIPLDAPEDMSIMSWLHGPNGGGGHLPLRVDPVISSVIKALRSSYSIEKLGGVGYCFAAKYVVRNLRANAFELLDAGFVAHPSFVTADELQTISAPLRIAAADNDPVFSIAKRREIEDILINHSSKGITSQISLYSEVDNGFTVRCDAKEQKQKFAMEQAFLQGVAWFNEYL
jgi:dienelactone hydrolase